MPAGRMQARGKGRRVFKTVGVGVGAGFLAIAGAAITPIVVGILAAFGGATVIVGIGAWRAVSRMRRRRSERGPVEALSYPVPPATLPPPSAEAGQ